MASCIEISKKYHIPFVGSIIGEYELFHFLLYQPIENGILILLPHWAYMQTQIQIGAMINFHFALKIDSLFVTKGQVEEIRKDDSQQGYLCKIVFVQRVTNVFNPFIQFMDQDWQVQLVNKRFEDIIVHSVKNCFLIKRGIEIYLQHLVAYFARIAGASPDQYALIKEHVFDDIHEKISANKKQLKYIYFQLKNKNDHNAMFQLLDPVRLMRLLEPELNFDLLNLMFDSRYHLPASEALKQLEDYIYWNYNNITMLLVSSLSKR